MLEVETSCTNRIKNKNIIVGRWWRVKVRDEGGYLTLQLSNIWFSIKGTESLIFDSLIFYVFVIMQSII